jgi:hypothetical protein
MGISTGVNDPNGARTQLYVGNIRYGEMGVNRMWNREG